MPNSRKLQSRLGAILTHNELLLESIQLLVKTTESPPVFSFEHLHTTNLFITISFHTVEQELVHHQSKRAS